MLEREEAGGGEVKKAVMVSQIIFFEEMMPYNCLWELSCGGREGAKD